MEEERLIGHEGRKNLSINTVYERKKNGWS
jgi:hypothetical protein